MSEEAEYHDPRMAETVEPKVDDLYGDARHKNDEGGYDEQWRIVYCDDEIVVMRSNENLNRKSGYRGKHHRLEHRDTFEKEAGSGRYKRIEESDEAPPRADEIHYHMGIVKRLIAHYDEKPGRTAAHKKEVLDELLELLEDFDAEERDWTNVDTIGQKASENLKDEGFVTDADVRVADEEALLDVSYVGESGVENLKEYVEE